MVIMISIFCSANNRYSRIGIHHFIEKFGISVSVDDSASSTMIVVSEPTLNKKCVINFQDQSIQNKICGNLHISGLDVPICQIPAETVSDGDIIAFFEQGTIRYPCITRNKDGNFMGIDIFNETGHILSGLYDGLRDSLDTATGRKLAAEPVVDILENLLFEELCVCCRYLDLPLVQKSYWPEGKSFAVCLTHDVDELKKTYQWISRPLRYLLKRDLQGFFGQIHSFFQKVRGLEPYFTFEDIIRIERDLNAKSSYYILKETGKAQLFSKKTWYLYGRNHSLQTREMRELLQRLVSNGDEVAIHGSYFSYREPELLLNETRELESIINEPVLGTRQHNLNLTIPETWEYQVKAGLKYDTSLGFKNAIGFRWGTSFPFYPVYEKGILPLMEIPLIIMDICLDSCQDKEGESLAIADKVCQYHGVLTLLWHPPIFNMMEYPGARDIYIIINQYCQHKGAWTVRARDIYDWLTQRRMNSFSCSFDGTTCIITPHSAGSELFFTLILPSESEFTVLSNNARIIKKEGVQVYIKTDRLRNEEKILVKLS